MNFKRSIALIPLLTLPLLAEAPKFGFEGQVSALAAIGDLNKMVRTGQTFGYNAGVGLRIEKNPGLGLRVYANLLSIRGVDGSGLEKSGPRHLNAGADVFKDIGKVTFFGGLGIVKWKQDVTDTTTATYTDAGGLNNEGKGTKLAGRIGMEYAITPKLHGVVSFTQTEFNKIYQPSWFSFGVSYRFASF
jgi:hypothetical protein